MILKPKEILNKFKSITPIKNTLSKLVVVILSISNIFCKFICFTYSCGIYVYHPLNLSINLSQFLVLASAKLIDSKCGFHNFHLPLG